MNNLQDPGVSRLTAPWGEAVPLWQHSSHYFPSLKELDKVISNLERLIWEREYLKHCDEKATDETIRSNDYKDPLADRRNLLLDMRNEFACFLGIKQRARHDISHDSLGY